MEVIKDALFNTLIIIGMMVICLVLIWIMLEILNHIFKATKYIIMYQVYKRDNSLYDLKDKVIITKDGSVSYTCVDDLDEQIDIMQKAIQGRKEIKRLREKYRR